jgi:hypothetical protein
VLSSVAALLDGLFEHPAGLSSRFNASFPALQGAFMSPLFP